MGKILIGVAVVGAMVIAGALFCCIKVGADADRQMEELFERRK